MIDLTQTFFIISCILIIYMLLCVARVILGPTLPDRVVALDTINSLVIATMITLGAAYKEVIYIDVAIVYAILSFVSTLFIAKYIESEK